MMRHLSDIERDAPPGSPANRDFPFVGIKNKWCRPPNSRVRHAVLLISEHKMKCSLLQPRN
jgi:hypothetical protein